MSRSGPIVSPGTSTSFDRSGTSISPIQRPGVHPFKVNCLGLVDGKVVFSINEGKTYTGSGLESASGVKIDTTTLTPVPADPLAPGIILGELTDGNVGMTYTVPIGGDKLYLYVRVARPADLSEDWKTELVCKPSAEANSEATTNPPTMVASGETSLGNASHGGFPVSMTTSAGMCGMTYTLTVNQQGKKFRANSVWAGTFQYPIATFQKMSDTVVCQQILRSDLFFPGTRTFSVEYIDTAVTQISLEASGTCPCGCGCGCGGCGGCCGGECGCTGCGCTGCGLDGGGGGGGGGGCGCGCSEGCGCVPPGC